MNCPSPGAARAGKGIIGSGTDSWAQIAGAWTKTPEKRKSKKDKSRRSRVFTNVPPESSRNAAVPWNLLDQDIQQFNIRGIRREDRGRAAVAG